MYSLVVNQREKALRFQALHQRPGVFLIPNPWDIGSAQVLAGLGFEALATSSRASAAVVGRHDGELTRDQAIAHAGAVAGATDLPVSADLENCFGDSPDMVAETIRMAADAGVAGGSVEDATGDNERPIYDVQLAAERVAAAVQAARSLPFPFILTARAENFIRGRPNLDNTIARLLAYEKMGADVLFAPGLPDLATVRAVCAAVKKPVNFMVGIRGKSFSIAELAEAGVKRISFGSALYRAAIGGLVATVTELKRSGTFACLDTLLPAAELNKFLPTNLMPGRTRT